MMFRGSKCDFLTQYVHYMWSFFKRDIRLYRFSNTQTTLLSYSLKIDFQRRFFHLRELLSLHFSLVNSNDQNVEYRQSGIANTPRDTC